VRKGAGAVGVATQHKKRCRRTAQCDSLGFHCLPSPDRLPRSIRVALLPERDEVPVSAIAGLILPLGSRSCSRPSSPPAPRAQGDLCLHHVRRTLQRCPALRHGSGARAGADPRAQTAAETPFERKESPNAQSNDHINSQDRRRRSQPTRRRSQGHACRTRRARGFGRSRAPPTAGSVVVTGR
jgi:hypothetical protein